jgi:Na+-driven multidrug efflux pump
MRAFVVCLIVMPPMYLVLWNSETILSAIIPRADPEMIHLAALYVKLSSLGILVRAMINFTGCDVLPADGQLACSPWPHLSASEGICRVWV